MEKTLIQAIQKALASFGLPKVEVELEHPADESFGDWSTNVALQYIKQTEEFSNSKEFADALLIKLREVLKENKDVDDVSVAGPGFINFTLTQQYFLNKLKNKQTIEKTETDKVIFEYMQPNTNKPLHVGHLRNSVLGIAMIHLLQEVGFSVSAATINNDRGLHIIKSMWGYLAFGKNSAKDSPGKWQELITQWTSDPSLWITPSEMEDIRLKKQDHFLGHWYVRADSFVDNEQTQKAWREMLFAWENEDDDFHNQVRSLWEKCNQWFYEGYQQSVEKIGVFFDKDQVSFESDIYQAGKEIVLAATKKGIFKKLENGAIAANLDKYNLPQKILLRSDGTAIYMTFDLELTRQRSAQKAAKYVWEVGSDQDLYFKQLFAISEMLGFGKQENFKHFSYGMVRLPEGKMSSRKGTVVYADEIIATAQARAVKIIDEAEVAKDFTSKEKDEVVEAVGMGALKWSLLAVDPTSNVFFDLKKSVNFSGNSGPYVQYSYARTQSILAKVTGDFSLSASVNLNVEEVALLRQIDRFNEIVHKSSAEYAPHELCMYLYELAQKFNTFYSKHSVLGAKEEKGLRILLTQRTGEVLTKGLSILGIDSPSKM